MLRRSRISSLWGWAAYLHPPIKIEPAIHVPWPEVSLQRGVYKITEQTYAAVMMNITRVVKSLITRFSVLGERTRCVVVVGFSTHRASTNLWVYAARLANDSR